MTENLLVSLNDIEEKEASWLVPQRMPKGQIIILAGDGGSGKTSITMNIYNHVDAARVQNEMKKLENVM